MKGYEECEEYEGYDEFDVDDGFKEASQFYNIFSSTLHAHDPLTLLKPFMLIVPFAP